VSTKTINQKFKSIKLLALDVDGVLTDGSIIYGDRGEEIKAFDVKDGLGIRMALDAGIRICIVTGRSSNALKHRCRNLGIDLVFDGIKHKASIIDTLTAETRLEPAQIAFMGDDLPDIGLMRRVGTAIAVKDAHPEVRLQADHTTSAAGGKGAVREVCELLLKAQGSYEKITAEWWT
jgi:3-deoxy-D-manno-octulosonate 8-phosphate phosphatase (KDO 8-P phosphatase)